MGLVFVGPANLGLTLRLHRLRLRGAFLFVGGFVDGYAEAGGIADGYLAVTDAQVGEFEHVRRELAILDHREVGDDHAHQGGLEHAELLGPGVRADQGAERCDFGRVVEETNIVPGYMPFLPQEEAEQETQ